MTHKVHAVGKHATSVISINEKKLQEVADATRLSPEFLGRMIKEEGFKTKQYSFAGIKYIGVGHNLDVDPRCKKPSTCPKSVSEGQVYDIFKEDLLAAEERVNRYTQGKFSSLNQGQREALLDVSFNVKPSSLKNSALVKAIIAGKPDSAVKEFGFVHIGGQVYAGSCKRRIHDIYLFAKETPSQSATDAINDIVQKAFHLDAKKRKAVQKAADAAKRKLEEAMELQKASQTLHDNPYKGLIIK